MRSPPLHKSSVVVAAVVAVLLVLVNVPGRVVDWQSFSTFEHGWPYVYLRRQTIPPPIVRYGLILRFIPFEYHNRRDALEAWADEAMWGIPWLRAANWRIWEARIVDGAPRRDFRERILLLNCVIASFVLLGAVGAWEWRRRRRPTLLSFTLTEFFLAVASISAVLGWGVYLAREHQREIRLIERVTAEHDPIADNWYAGDEICIAPTWVRSLAGERLLPDFLWRTSTVDIQRQWLGDNTGSIGDEISQLRYVSTIVLESGNLRDGFRFSALKHVKRLETLELREYRPLDVQDVKELSQLPQLKTIVIEEKDEIAGEVVQALQAALPNCKIVDYLDDW